MIFEKDVVKAIQILKDICFIIPPMDIEDLSYNTDDKVFSKKVGL